MGDLAGKTVLITGACGDIGRACAKLFKEQGASLALIDLARPPPLPDEDAGFWMADVTDRAAVSAAVEAAVGRFGRVDAAVLAAGVEGPVAPVEEISEADFDRVMAVNVKGGLFTMQACLPRMKAQGSGSIVALSSISGVVGAAALGAYAASKHAILGLVRTAALETGREGVRVNAICPGPIQSTMMRRLDEALSARDPSRAQGQPDGARSIPLQRYVTAEEVARMAAFLCSDHAASCHGGVYMVDGGFTAR